MTMHILQTDLTRTLRVSLLSLLLVAGGASADEIRVGSGASVANQILKPVKTGFEAASKHSLSISEQGPRLALEDVLKGRLEGAGVILTPEEITALFAKDASLEPQKLVQNVIGSTRIVAITNPSNPVGQLTKDQLTAIFSGKVLSWKDIGGADQPIVLVLGKLTKGVNEFYLNKFLATGIPKDIFEASSANDVRDAVAANPEAIGITPAAVPNDTVKVPVQPVAESAMYLYTLGAPKPAVKSLLDYIAGPGKAVIK